MNQLSYIINQLLRWIFSHTWLFSYDTKDRKLCKNVTEVWFQRVCVYAHVFGLVRCPAVTGQNICWTQSKRVKRNKELALDVCGHVSPD